MGRLRQLSASLKAAAFHSTASRSNSPLGDTSEPSTEVVSKGGPAVLKDTTVASLSEPAASVGRAERSSRPTSVVYHFPSLETGRDNQKIEELVPVFRFAGS